MDKKLVDPWNKRQLSLSIKTNLQSLSVLLAPSVGANFQLLHVFISGADVTLWYHNEDKKCLNETMRIWIENEHSAVVPGRVAISPHSQKGKGTILVGFIITSDSFENVRANKTYLVVDTLNFYGRAAIPPYQPSPPLPPVVQPPPIVQSPHAAQSRPTVQPSLTIKSLPANHLESSDTSLSEKDVSPKAESGIPNPKWIAERSTQKHSGRGPPLDLPPGWKITRTPRKLNPKKVNTSYTSPSGQTFYTKREVIEYLTTNTSKGDPSTKSSAPPQMNVGFSFHNVQTNDKQLSNNKQLPNHTPQQPVISKNMAKLQEMFYQKALSMQLQYYREQFDIQQTCVKLHIQQSQYPSTNSNSIQLPKPNSSQTSQTSQSLQSLQSLQPLQPSQPSQTSQPSQPSQTSLPSQPTSLPSQPSSQPLQTPQTPQASQNSQSPYPPQPPTAQSQSQSQKQIFKITEYKKMQNGSLFCMPARKEELNVQDQQSQFSQSSQSSQFSQFSQSSPPPSQILPPQASSQSSESLLPPSQPSSSSSLPQPPPSQSPFSSQAVLAHKALNALPLQTPLPSPPAQPSLPLLPSILPSLPQLNQESNQVNQSQTNHILVQAVHPSIPDCNKIMQCTELQWLQDYVSKITK